MKKRYKFKPKYDGGLRDFELYMAGEKKNCENKCVFCFIDQLPRGCLRRSLYCKDDDERLSFLFGNYITLTNLADADIAGIIKMRVTPINISVHTTDPALRVKMMNNPRAGAALGYMKKLAEGGIALNAQVVVCKNINDGEKLEKTISELCALYPAMQSVALVPAGLTKYREENGLFKIEPLNKSDCEKIIAAADKFGGENLRNFGTRLVYCSDELYLKAGRKIPGSEYYENYPQYENGVGMIRSFYDEAVQGVSSAPRKISVVTGEAAYDLIKETAARVNKECRVYKIKNNFFGGEITVAGLVTGCDIIEQLMPDKNNLGEELLIPAVMLRHERDLFLDNTSVADIESALGVKVKIAENGAGEFIKAVTNSYE